MRNLKKIFSVVLVCLFFSSLGGDFCFSLVEMKFHSGYQKYDKKKLFVRACDHDIPFPCHAKLS